MRKGCIIRGFTLGRNAALDPFFVFVHIPKTGGTSVRFAARAYFGEERMLYDYGPEQALTSDLVQTWIHERQDFAGFAAEARAGGYRFFSGHFGKRYRKAFSEAVFLTWLRDPRDRVWSAYRHACRRHGYEGSLDTFSALPGRRDVQWRDTGGSLDHFDFVGVLERNSESFRRLNTAYGLELKEQRANFAPAGDGLTRPDEAARARLAELNGRDLELHRQALERFARPDDPAGQGPRPAVA